MNLKTIRLVVSLMAAPQIFSCAFALTPAQIMPKDYNEVFPATLSEIRYGPPEMSRQECDAKPNTVWVSASWRESSLFGESKQSAEGCIRYFPSDDVGVAKQLMIYIHGDRVEKEGFKDGNYKTQVRVSNQIARENGMAVIQLARPGVYGSTAANHYEDRRMPKEAHLVHAAIDAIKAKHGYGRIHLVGQSGGGGLTIAMLTLGRSDIDCAVSSSGVAAVKRRMWTLNSTATRDATGQDLGATYDPYDHMDKIIPDSRRRIFFLADKRDKRVPYESQQIVHEALLKRGLSSVFIEGEATDRNFHGLGAFGQRVVGWCAAGLSNEDITRRVAAKERGLFYIPPQKKQAMAAMQ